MDKTKLNYRNMRKAIRINGNDQDFDTYVYWLGDRLGRKVHDTVVNQMFDFDTLGQRQRVLANKAARLIIRTCPHKGTRYISWNYEDFGRKALLGRLNKY